MNSKALMIIEVRVYSPKAIIDERQHKRDPGWIFNLNDKNIAFDIDDTYNVKQKIQCSKSNVTWRFGQRDGSRLEPNDEVSRRNGWSN